MNTNNLPFPYQSFNPAKNIDIQLFEEKYKINLADDYKEFLKQFNGLNLAWWHLDNNLDIHKDSYQVNKYGYVETIYPFYEDLEKNSQWDWVYEVDKIFGIGNKDQYLDMANFNMEHCGWHPDLMPYAYPVGVDKGGNLLLQIIQGKNRGKLAMLDHEVAGPMVDWIKGIKSDETFKIPPEKATADEFFEDCFAYGGLTLYNITFQDFFNELIAKHTKLYQLMKRKYRK